MKLNEFVSQVLLDINSGIKTAYESSDRKYYVDTTNGNGVTFDVAVTTTTQSETSADGKISAGIIEVLGANVSGKIQGKTENSEVSRIKFTINVPYDTQAEYHENIRRSQAQIEQQTQREW